MAPTERFRLHAWVDESMRNFGTSTPPCTCWVPLWLILTSATRPG